MSRGLQAQGGRVLLAIAAPTEAKAAASAFGAAAPDTPWQLTPFDDRFECVLTGVGKAAAAGGVARTLDPRRHELVMSVGIGGALSRFLRLGQAVVATTSDLVDDGVPTGDGFLTLDRLGFGPFPGGGVGGQPPDRVLERLRTETDVAGPVATVSTCSASDAASSGLAARGYVAEAMEGAAVALVAARLSVPFAEVRIISNTTGERSRQKWDLPGSLEALSEVLGRIRAL